MTTVDTSEWRDYQIGKIFKTIDGANHQVPTGAYVPKGKLEEDGHTPRITVTEFNNGIVGYFDYPGNAEDAEDIEDAEDAEDIEDIEDIEDTKDANYRTHSNFISVSFLGTVFYQQYEASLDMKVHCLQLQGVEL